MASHPLWCKFRQGWCLPPPPSPSPAPLPPLALAHSNPPEIMTTDTSGLAIVEIKPGGLQALQISGPSQPSCWAHSSQLPEWRHLRNSISVNEVRVIKSKQFHEDRLPVQCSKPGVARSPQPGTSKCTHLLQRVTEYCITLLLAGCKF